MKSCLPLMILAVMIAALVVLFSCAYTVTEQEQVILTQFGKPVGEPVLEAGLHFKLPFVQVVNRFEKRVLEWDGPSTKMPTKDKVYIVADTFGRWRISEPLLFFQQLRDERSAQSRLDDILGSETRNVIARHDFIEAVRTTKGRKVAKEETATSGSIADARIGVLPDITKGRSELEKEIFEKAAPKVISFGIELMDVRFKRLNYNETVSQTIYQRMISEREQIAERYRSEGAGEAAKILGQREREMSEIESEAYRKVQEIEGAADAKATEIYAKAYNQTKESAELFEFLKTMDTYKSTITGDSTLILTTDSEFLKFLKSSNPAPAIPDGSLMKTLQGLPSLLDIPGAPKTGQQ